MRARLVMVGVGADGTEELVAVAEGRRRAVNGPQLVALVAAGASVARGKLLQRAEPDHQRQEAAA